MNFGNFCSICGVLYRVFFNIATMIIFTVTCYFYIFIPENPHVIIQKICKIIVQKWVVLIIWKNPQLHVFFFCVCACEKLLGCVEFSEYLENSCEKGLDLPNTTVDSTEYPNFSEFSTNKTLKLNIFVEFPNYSGYSLLFVANINLPNRLSQLFRTFLTNLLYTSIIEPVRIDSPPMIST